MKVFADKDLGCSSTAKRPRPERHRRGRSFVGFVIITDHWLASLTRTRTFASLSLSDPLPGLIEIPLTVLRVLARKLRNRG